MVKVTNTGGDFRRGKQGPGVYQGFYGKQIRRKLKPEKNNTSQKQREVQGRFKEGLAFAETLSPIEKTALIKYIASGDLKLTWHNYAKLICMAQVRTDLSRLLAYNAAFPSVFTNWGYRNPVDIIGDGKLIVLLKLQGTDPLKENYIDFSKFLSNLADMRIAADDGVTQLSYFIESFDLAALTARVWVRLI